MLTSVNVARMNIASRDFNNLMTGQDYENILRDP